MTSPLELTVTKTIPAPQKDVFRAWLDPATLAKFMRPMEGMPEPKVEADPQVGGNFLIMMKAGDKELAHRGEYLELREYDRIVFTWLSDFTIPDSTVTLSFEEAGANETKVTLHHIGFPAPEVRDNHNGGWASILAALSKTVA